MKLWNGEKSLHHMTRLPSNSIKTLKFWHQLGCPILCFTLFMHYMTKEGCFLDNTPLFKTKWQKCWFYSAPCTGIFSRFDFSFPCNLYIRKFCGTTHIPLDQENCGACSLLYMLMAASKRYKKTGKNLHFSSKMADICLQIKCREQRDYPPWSMPSW